MSLSELKRSLSSHRLLQPIDIVIGTLDKLFVQVQVGLILVHLTTTGQLMGQSTDGALALSVCLSAATRSIWVRSGGI